MQDAQRLHALPQLFSDLAHVLRTEVVERHQEFLTAVARRDIEGPAREALYDLRHAAQRRIAGLMPVAVVVGLEVIDVEEEQGNGAAVAYRELPEARVVVVECATVLQAGEAVARDHLAEKPALQKRRAQL